jgi:hypothetical protein
MTYLFVLLDNNHACTENLVIVWKLGLQLCTCAISAYHH